MSVIEVQPTDTAVPLELLLTRNGIGVPGLAPTVAIRLPGTSPSAYLDWASFTWKTSGWTTQFQPMTDVANGRYEVIFNIAQFNYTQGTKLIVEYHCSAGVPGDSTDVISITTNLELIRKYATNKLVQASGDPGTLTLYDDNGVTVLKTHQLLDELGNAVLPAVGTPGQRSAGT